MSPIRQALVCAFVAAACGEDPGATDAGADADTDADTDTGPPTVAEICAAREACVDGADPHAGDCQQVFGVIEESAFAGCEQCLRCLDSATCENWTESPNGPLGCEDSCRPCEAAAAGDDGEFWDDCATDGDCAYAHWCVEARGNCQRICDDNLQCNLSVCGEDRFCWLLCGGGDPRCPPEAECTPRTDKSGNTISTCAGGE
jgi:hypothetical protein